MKKALLTLVIAAGFAASGAATRADDKTVAPKEVFLGLGVEVVPPALHSQIPGILPKGQGVLVSQVAKDSPAAKAGLQPNDILMSYGDQKLYSPEQLVKLVRGDKAGHEIAVNYIRGGKTMACKVTLGAAEPGSQPENPRVFRLTPDERLRKIFEEFETNSNGSAWDSFDSLRLTRVDGKHWKAEIDFRSNEGKKASRTYTGTRDEIRKAIQAEKDMPANERNQLLRALNLQDPVFEFHFPPLGSIPEDFHNRP